MSKVNYLALVIGPPEHGKTSLAAHLAEQRLKAGRVVLVQDAGREYSAICTYYPSPAAYLRALAEHAAAGTEMPRGAAFGVGADAVLELARQLGEAWNKPHAEPPAPITVVINEASSSVETGATWMGKLADLVINQRRHLGLELVYCLQRPTQLHPAFYDSATNVAIFRQTRTKSIRYLASQLGIEDSAVWPALSLDKHQYLAWPAS
jgi:hypothetical protein